MNHQTKELEIFFSNRLEILYEYLKNSLFSKNLDSPLPKRIVVVYGPAMKNWLMLKMAQDPDLQVAMGIEFVYLHQAFEYLLSYSSNPPNEYLPSLLELTLVIEEKLTRMIHNYPQLHKEEQEDWHPLLIYLQLDPSDAPTHISLKTTRRVVSLSRYLARLFQEYGCYGTHLLTKWENYESHEKWQKRLWKQLFHESLPWSYPIKILNQKSFDFSFSLHFFSISYLSPIEFDFLRNLTSSLTVHYYLLSPCAVFWSDIRSDQETVYLTTYWKKKGAPASYLLDLENLLRDRNPLLANFGRLGREMACQIENSLASSYLHYTLPICTQLLAGDDLQPDVYYYETNEKLSLLQALQADLLLMRVTHQGAAIFNFEEERGSIQCHIAPTKRREIEILYHNFLHLLSQNPTLSPSDFLVMAPNLEEYIPYIQTIFGLSDSLLSFHILDSTLHTQSEIVQGFLQLFALSESCWETNQLLQLFGHPSFQRRHQITSEEYVIMQEWIEKTGIRWGYDSTHRSTLLTNRYCQQEMVENSGMGTWEYGFTRLLFGLASLQRNYSSLPFEVASYGGIEFSQTDLLEKWMYLLYSLHDDLAPLQDSTHMKMEDWRNYLICLLENYLQPDGEDEKALYHYEEMKKQIELLSSSSRFCEQNEFSFISVKEYLLSLLQQPCMSYQEELTSSIRFGSLVPMRSIPFQVIALIGMQEGAFPRTPEHSSLNLMKKEKYKDYLPSLLDYDRYLFLEILHTAQSYLLCSYLGYEQGDGRELRPCLVLEELFSYLDHSYSIQGKKISEKCIHKHPFDTYNYLYFCKDSHFHNFRFSDFAAATSYYSCKSPPHTFLDCFLPAQSCELLSSVGLQIDLYSLNAVAKNPIKFHLNKVLGIYLPNKKSHKMAIGEELHISSLDKYLLKQFSLEQDVEKVLYQADREGKLPFGVFKTIATKQIKEDIQDTQKQLQKHGLTVKDFIQIEFQTTCVQPMQLNSHQWIFPAPLVIDNEQRIIAITGKIPRVTPQGFLVVGGRATLSEVWKVWPQFLLYCYAAMLCPTIFQPRLIFSHVAKPKEAFFTDPLPILADFIAYYGQCLAHFSPLLPEWIPLILDADEEGLHQKTKQMYNDYLEYDFHQEMRWILPKHHSPHFVPSITAWQAQAEILVKNIKDHWYPSR